MHPTSPERRHSCPADCAGCSPDGESALAGPSAAGWVTALVCIAGFLLPPTGAIIGATAMSQWWTGVGGQVVGAAAGLAGGVVGGMLLVRALLSATKDDKSR